MLPQLFKSVATIICYCHFLQVLNDHRLGCYTFVPASEHLYTEQSGAAEACWAHNPEVDGSKPSSANYIFSGAARLFMQDKEVIGTHTRQMYLLRVINRVFTLLVGWECFGCLSARNISILLCISAYRTPFLTVVSKDMQVVWPSGLRRWIKAPVSQEAWVQIPPLPFANVRNQLICWIYIQVSEAGIAIWLKMVLLIGKEKLNEMHLMLNLQEGITDSEFTVSPHWVILNITWFIRFLVQWLV